MEDEYVEIDLRAILAGLASGGVASLWTIIPFFMPAPNLIYLTVSAGILLLLVLTKFRKDELLKSGIFAAGAFLAISYIIVPFAATLVFESPSEPLPENRENLAELYIELPNMFCQGCAYNARNALLGIEGVVDARVDFETKTAAVIYDPSIVSPGEILSNEIIKGYGGRVAESS